MAAKKVAKKQVEYPEYLEIAAKCLKKRPEQIPVALRRRLEKANRLCQSAGGALRSRQAIAAIIVAFK